MENQSTKINKESVNKYPADDLKKYEPFKLSDYMEIGDGIDVKEVDEKASTMHEGENIVLFDDYDIKDLNDADEGNLRKISEFELMLILLKRNNKGTFSIEKEVDEDTGLGQYYIRYTIDWKTKDLTYGHDTIYDALYRFVDDNDSLIFGYEYGEVYRDFEEFVEDKKGIDIKITYDSQDENYVYFSSEEMEEDDDTN